MNLQQALATIEPTRYGSACTVSVILAELGDDDREALKAALDNPKITTRGIAQALAAIGHEVGVGTLARHRRRADGAGCRCPL